MKIKIISILFIVILIATGIVGKFAYDKYYYRDMLNPNFVRVVNKTELDSKFFKVTWNTENLTLFENEKYLNPQFKEYGKNTFSVWYKDRLMGKFYQFKRNNWHGHTYSFFIENEDSVAWNVEGPDQRISKIAINNRN